MSVRIYQGDAGIQMGVGADPLIMPDGELRFEEVLLFADADEDPRVPFRVAGHKEVFVWDGCSHGLAVGDGDVTLHQDWWLRPIPDRLW